MENGMAGLRINDDDEEVLQVAGVSKGQNRMYDLCLVGCFLTSSVVQFQVIRNTLANLWHPLGGIEISDLGEKRIDVRSPLKRKKKIQLSPQNHTYEYESDVKWKMTGFYVSPDSRSRADLWNLLRELGRDQSLPWMVCGDFNEIVYSFENK
ncbi:hypothetical protein Gogos_013087 [Gossypium gossypioides]|uniref:DUF4283 domain-containing protein n=1 Tax=Gossypium gossypioides TaxID=34282 RepID=A0A7J9BUN2_GOSGO|nr:hypothetical protein [Gossypium gossypioides]